MSNHVIRYVDPRNLIVKNLQNGGSAEMAVNGSITPVNFDYVVPEGFRFFWYRFIIMMSDGAKVFNATEFGTIPALTNGCTISIIDDQLTPAEAISVNALMGSGAFKKNADFAQLAGNDVQTLVDGRGIAARWTLSRMTGGHPTMLPSGWGVRFTINDDLTALDEVRSCVQGFKVGGEIRGTDITRA